MQKTTDIQQKIDVSITTAVIVLMQMVKTPS